MEPTKIDKQPDRRYEERRYVETAVQTRENTVSSIREVYRDSWMTDEQAVRLNCVSLACGVVEKPLFSKDDETPKVEENVLRIAEAFRIYVEDGTL